MQRFGYADRNEAVEIVNLRLKMELGVDKPDSVARELAGPDPGAALVETTDVVFREGAAPARLYDRDLLLPGNRVAGPALLLQLDTTVVVPPGWGGAVDPYGNLVVEQD